MSGGTYRTCCHRLPSLCQSEASRLWFWLKKPNTYWGQGGNIHEQSGSQSTCAKLEGMCPSKGQPLPTASQSRPNGGMANSYRTCPFFKRIQKSVFLFETSSFEDVATNSFPHTWGGSGEGANQTQLLGQTRPELYHLPTSAFSHGSLLKTRYSILVLKHSNTSAI